MTNKFVGAVSALTDLDLLKMLTGPEENYQPAALEAARIEFSKRNISPESLASLKQAIEYEQKILHDRANLPLDVSWKVLTFMFPALIQIILSGTFLADGYDRKAKELVKWTFYGWTFYVGLIAFVVLLAVCF